MGEAALLVRVGGYLKRLIKNPWFWAILLVVAVGGGTYYYLHTDKKEAVSTAVQQADQKATNASLKAQDEANNRVAAQDQKFIILHDQTVKDFTNARADLEAHPQAERDAPAPRILIDTLNGLDRMRAARDPNPVPDASVPVG